MIEVGNDWKVQLHDTFQSFHYQVHTQYLMIFCNPVE